MNKASAALLALLALSQGACDDKEAERRAAKAHEEAERTRKDEVVARLGPEVRKLVAKVDLLRPALARVPRSPDDAAPPRTEPRMQLSETKMDDKAGNTDLLFEGELGLLRRGMVGTCNYYLRSGSGDLTAERLDEIFSRGLRTRYFLVVRVDEQKKPKITGGNTYTEGTLEGDVAVFDLGADPPRALGSFPIRTELTKTVKIRPNADRESIQYALDEALRDTALETIERALAR